MADTPADISSHRNTNGKYCVVYQRIDTGSETPFFVKTRQISAEHFKTA